MSQTQLKISNVVNFVWKNCIANVLKYLKIYGFDKILPSNCLKQISFNQKCLISQNQFQFDNSNAFLKSILYECQRPCKFEYLYSNFLYGMSGDAIYCTDSAMLLFAGKQRPIDSFVNKGSKGCDNIPQKPVLKSKESVS